MSEKKKLSKTDEKYFKKLFLQEILTKILPAYDDTGLTVNEYYNNIMLPELTNQEFQWLKEATDGNF
jgi:hypothetical protein